MRTVRWVNFEPLRAWRREHDQRANSCQTKMLTTTRIKDLIAFIANPRFPDYPGFPAVAEGFISSSPENAKARNRKSFGKNRWFVAELSNQSWLYPR
jgi:hypothetical protein